VEVSSICSGAPLACVGLFVGMGDTATKEVLEWALGCTDVVKASAVVTRLMNDIASFKVQIKSPRIPPIYLISIF
jgi:hypothetical protein